jgi:hypothetical protein
VLAPLLDGGFERGGEVDHDVADVDLAGSEGMAPAWNPRRFRKRRR